MRSFSAIVTTVLALAILAGCPSKYPKCSNDKDCHEKEYCVNGNCQQCREDKDCKKGERCAAGRCETATCSDDSQCPPGQSCLGGLCKPCMSDSECGPGGKCNGGKCSRPSTNSSGEPASEPTAGCNLDPVYFDFNEYTPSTEANAAIDRNGECLKKTPNRNTTLVGHSDPRGTEEYNMALGDKRAQAVRDRLGRMGLNEKKLTTVSKGELEASGTDEAGWARDRRVEFK